MSDYLDALISRLAPPPSATGWESVTPVVERRRRTDGSYEYRPKRRTTGPEAVAVDSPRIEPDRGMAALRIGSLGGPSLGDLGRAGQNFLSGAKGTAALALAAPDLTAGNLLRSIDSLATGPGRQADPNLPRAMAAMAQSRRGAPVQLPASLTPAPTEPDPFAPAELAAGTVESIGEEYERLKADAQRRPGDYLPYLDAPLAFALPQAAGMMADPAMVLASGGAASLARRAVPEVLETAGQRTLRKAMGGMAGEAIEAPAASGRALPAVREALNESEVAAARLRPAIIDAGYGGDDEARQFGYWLEKNGVNVEHAERYGEIDGLRDEFFRLQEPEPPGLTPGVGYEIPRHEAVPLAQPGAVQAPAVERLTDAPVTPFTAIKNAVTTEERAARGLPEVDILRRTDAEAFEHGKSVVDSGEIDPRLLAKQIAEKGRKGSLSADEEANILLYDRMRLYNESRATEDALGRARTSGDRAAETDALIRRESLDRAINFNDEAVKRGGHEWSAAGRARQLLIREDYSAARLVQRVRVAAGAEPSEALRGKLTGLGRKIEEASDAVAAHETKAAERSARRGVERIKRDVAYESRRARRAVTREELADEFSALSREFGQKAATPRTGLDPELAALIGKMAKNRVHAGVNGLEEVVDHVYQAVRPHVEGLTERDVRDAISGYGREPGKATRSALARELAEIRTQGRLVSRLEDVEAGRIPSRRPGAKQAPSARVEDLRRQVREAMDRQKIPKAPDQVRLEALKKRLAKRGEELNRQLAAGDFAKRPRPPAVLLDPEAVRLKARVESLRREADAAIKKIELAQRGPLDKGLDFTAKWGRAVKLSGMATLSKIGAAAGVRTLLFTPIEEAIGGALSKLPVIRQVAAKAPIEGGFSARAIADSYAEFFSKATVKDVWGHLRRMEEGELDLLYGKGGHDVEHWFDWFGHAHAAIKTPPKRAAFKLAMRKQAIYYLERGEGEALTDPARQAEMATRAYEYAQRQIFMGDNAFVSWWTRSTLASAGDSAPTRVTKATGRVLLPIVKVPSNYVLEATDYSLGLPKGVLRIGFAMKKGLASLPEREAETIMRQLKKGTFGAGLIALGVAGLEQVEGGGYYVDGERRREGDMHPGDVRLFGVTIPHQLAHHPAVEMIQIGATMRRIQESSRHSSTAAGVLAAGRGLGRQVPFFEEPVDLAESTKSPSKAQHYAGEVGRGLTIPPDIQRAARILDEGGEHDAADFLLKQLGLRHIDTTKRYPENFFWDEFKVGIPGLREDVSSRRPRH